MVLKLPKNPPKKVKVADDQLWVEKDGTIIAVSDMTEQHAKNCLCMLIRKLRETKEKLKGKALLQHILKLKAMELEDEGMVFDPDENNWGDK